MSYHYIKPKVSENSLINSLSLSPLQLNFFLLILELTKYPDTQHQNPEFMLYFSIPLTFYTQPISKSCLLNDILFAASSLP